MGEQKTCNDKPLDVGFLSSHATCSQRCLGHASMFSFGVPGTRSCNESGCLCLCHTHAHEAGVCDEVRSESLRLYTYSGKDLLFLDLFLDIYLLERVLINLESFNKCITLDIPSLSPPFPNVTLRNDKSIFT